MIKFRLYTRYGKSYLIHDNGNIERTDMEFTPSGEWRLEGIRHVHRNEFYPFKDITPDLINSLTLLYKNGNPQYTVVDYDHGTRREWGNTKYHGISSISFDVEEENAKLVKI
jgi:hypothetical protein